MLGAQRRALRFNLPRQHALFVAMAEDVFDDRFHVVLLRSAFREVVGADRIGFNALKEEATSPLLARRNFVPAIADRRDRPADVRGVKLVDQREAVALVLSEGHERFDLIWIGRLIAVLIDTASGRKLFAFANELLHTSHRYG